MREIQNEFTIPTTRIDCKEVTVMDQELFELCKDVYERTKWNPGYWHTKRHGIQKQDGVFKWGGIKTAPVITAENIAPAYTSDYLLKKLPAYIGSGHFEMANFDTAGWKVGYYNGKPTLVVLEYTVQDADTPLKALLKLAIALHEAGELK